ncbi:MAG: GDSL family lipase [Lachnospiraceae bacterium]|nr:GDSL family lipase [Lachnospiraceae bacterium]
MKFQAEKKNVRVTGRTIYREGIRYLGYSATAVSFCFTGTKAIATLISDAESRAEAERAWVAVFVGESRQPEKRICLQRDRQDVVLYESSETKTVQVTLMKFSEAEFASCGIVELEIADGNAPGQEKLLPPPAHKERQIEFFGDSITCGYGVEGDVDNLEFNTAEENPMKSYSMITAGLLDAEANLVSWNGKGVISAYVGDVENVDADTSWLMPDLYPYTDAGRERDYFGTPREQWELWNFSDYKPQLVIIYLGTNDASYTREIPERNKRFEDAYVNMLGMIREKNPGVSILCTIGTMDPRLNETIEGSVARYKRENPDCNIRFVLLPEQIEEDGLGTFWHPTEATNRKSAKIIAEAAKEMMGW